MLCQGCLERAEYCNEQESDVAHRECHRCRSAYRVHDAWRERNTDASVESMAKMLPRRKAPKVMKNFAETLARDLRDTTAEKLAMFEKLLGT